jgi:hypothetical protein
MIKIKLNLKEGKEANNGKEARFPIKRYQIISILELKAIKFSYLK